MKETLSRHEWVIMETLWQRAPLFLSDLMSAMETSVDWNRSSYLTYLKRMTDKGYIGYDTVRGSRRYIPLIRREDCVAAESAALLEKMTGQSAKLFLVSLVEKSGLGESDRAELQALIARLGEGQKEGGSK
ncbi:MAG TPA: BlaI/MecI/CopY family transcriptional regulator [Feifaniaceae bacterium]|nr:BlaI/MecI/CopY family transcriptional regulator [Feifaniaceae bacterium]